MDVMTEMGPFRPPPPGTTVQGGMSRWAGWPPDCCGQHVALSGGGCSWIHVLVCASVLMGGERTHVLT